MRSGLVVAALVGSPTVALASGPSGACRDGAAQCREAYDKLDKCQHSKDGKKDGACATEKTDADSACKNTNMACVKGRASGKPAHTRKD